MWNSVELGNTVLGKIIYRVSIAVVRMFEGVIPKPLFIGIVCQSEIP